MKKNLISIVLFILACIFSYVALVEVATEMSFNPGRSAYANTLGVVWTLCCNTISFNIALLCFLGSAIAERMMFVKLIMIKLLLYVAWLCLTHAGIHFLPGIEHIYVSGWMKFTWRCVATFMALGVGFIFYWIGAVIASIKEALTEESQPDYKWISYED